MCRHRTLQTPPPRNRAPGGGELPAGRTGWGQSSLSVPAAAGGQSGSGPAGAVTNLHPPRRPPSFLAQLFWGPVSVYGSRSPHGLAASETEAELPRPPPPPKEPMWTQRHCVRGPELVPMGFTRSWNLKSLWHRVCPLWPAVHPGKDLQKCHRQSGSVTWQGGRPGTAALCPLQVHCQVICKLNQLIDAPGSPQRNGVKLRPGRSPANKLARLRVGRHARHTRG